jgi:hypothetical protein
MARTFRLNPPLYDDGTPSFPVGIGECTLEGKRLVVGVFAPQIHGRLKDLVVT